MGYTPLGHKESDTIERLSLSTNSSTPVILAWKIPWTEESGGLQSMGSQRVGHN